jgi:hypothetical protein
VACCGGRAAGRSTAGPGAVGSATAEGRRREKGKEGREKGKEEKEKRKREKKIGKRKNRKGKKKKERKGRGKGV